MIDFQTVAGSIDAIMGVKAVWFRLNAPVMGFGRRGRTVDKKVPNFGLAKKTAEMAINQPYLVTIGSGKSDAPKFRGRVLELVRVTGVYGETKAFIRDPLLKEKLERWPVAVMLSEIYSIEGEPHIVSDLGFSDLRILSGSFDRVLRDEEKLENLWDALRERPVKRRHEIKLPPGFHDPGRVVLCGSQFPPLSATEGEKLRKESVRRERDPQLSQAVKAANRDQHQGLVTCECCGLADEDSALFDAHHLNPLFCGVRESRPDDFVVLCPTCHRWAHEKAESRRYPLGIEELRKHRGYNQD